VKWGLYGLHRSVDPEPVARRAGLAEAAGFESLWVGDHIAPPADLGGKLPRLEAVAAATYLAAVTATIRIGLGVIVLPQRQPVLLAKQLTSIDMLSRGRLIVGIGAGYVEPELAAMGVSLAERGPRTDEYLAVMRTLWTEPDPSFEGQFVGFDGVHQQPPPYQLPYPPIVVGGHSPAAFRRAVRHGNGWYGVYLDVPEATEVIAGLRRTLASTERPAELGELEITITPPPGGVDLDTARRYADLGVHRLTIQPADIDDSDVERVIESVAERLMGEV
jgi:probable F420-dependent oxidoreductase